MKFWLDAAWLGEVLPEQGMYARVFCRLKTISRKECGGYVKHRIIGASCRRVTLAFAEKNFSRAKRVASFLE